MNLSKVGEGKVVLLSGGGKCWTDIAARFTRSEADLDTIIGSEYDKNLVKAILNSNHTAATEFDYFLFGVEGYARVTEVQLVRKRLASYLIKSGRVNKKGKRSFDVVMPESTLSTNIEGFVNVSPDKVLFNGLPLADVIEVKDDDYVTVNLSSMDILNAIETWYESGVSQNVPEEDLRYLKPQATEFKALIGMNAHALLDWFKIRTCLRAQTEIRHLATSMMSLCKEAAPDLFINAGPSCLALGYCPEDNMQHPNCTKIRKSEALQVLADYAKNNPKEKN